MSKIKWCLNKKEGLELIESNLNLSQLYLRKAEDALISMGEVQVKDWKISTGYYAIYFSLYSILMKIGVKCEIHSCTIEFVKEFLKEYFTEDEISFVGNSLKARIDSQYYVNRAVSEKSYEDILNNTPKFMIKCKSILPKLTESKINKI